MLKNSYNNKTHHLPIAFHQRTLQRLTLLLFIISLSITTLSACGMLPQKEELSMAPVEKEYEENEYQIVTVEEGTVALEKDIECTYAQMKEEDLSFALSGMIVAHTYYGAGDSVKKGQLLAELDLGDLEEELEETEYSIGESKLLISHNKKSLKLELERQDLISKQSGLSKDDADKAEDEIQNKYNTMIQTYEDDLYLDKIQKASIVEKIENRRIYAGMDGTVSFIKQDLEGSQSRKGEVIIKIIDSSQSAFTVTGEDASYFTEGEEVTVDTSANSYDSVVQISKNEDNTIYFQLKTPDVKLGMGERGTIHLELDKRENIMYLPVGVVHKAGDSYYVYYVDDTGVQNMKTIEVGMNNNENIEIISGLKLGEEVIAK